MFNVSNKALISWFVTQFNVVKVIDISKVAGLEVRQKFKFVYDHFQLLICLGGVLLQIASK